VICPSCKAENDDEADNCIHCGKGLYVLVKGDVLLGRWEVQGVLGKGGMGMVYKAHDRDLDETVAIKVIRGGADTPEMAKRFRSEIKLARRVRHPNVCGIHEYQQDAHRRFIVMEYIEGADYRQILRQKGVLPPEDAFEVAIQVGEGLEAIHRAGIVHRDLKTPNIMKDAKGVVRLMDFGIAKQYDSASTAGATQTGHIVGTPEYMSPEQAQGHPVDPRSDVYALGIVTFELFTGAVPFRGDTPVATLMMHFQTPPPLQGVAALPPPLVPVLQRALAKAKAERYASGGQMAAALRTARDEFLRSPRTARAATAERRPGAGPTPATRRPTSSGSGTFIRTTTPAPTGDVTVKTPKPEGEDLPTVPSRPLSGRTPMPMTPMATPTPGSIRRLAETRIALLLWNAQVRYQRCRDGVIEELRAEGFVEPQVGITVAHADAHPDRVVELARQFAGEGMNVVVPVGTSAAVGAAAEIKDIPVVFAFVFDPVTSRIAKSWKSSGNNTTGSSSKTPAPLLLKSLREIAEVKKLAVLYTPGERNTEAQLADFQALKVSDLEVIPSPISDRPDIAPTIAKLEGTAEAVLLAGSAVIGDNAAYIVQLANKARLLTATQSQGLESRVLLGVTVNPDDVGRLAGKKCAMVLKGEKPASIEIEALATSDVIINLRVAKALDLNIPEGVKRAATRLVE
jgi:serine/threonine protein kinase/ABC-type uncharacterized transport system substrate-binding protein